MALDSIIVLHHVLSDLPLSIDLLFSASSIFTAFHLFSNTWTSGFILAEELTPLLSSPPFPDIIPSLTIGWFLNEYFDVQSSSKRKNKASNRKEIDAPEKPGSTYLPADYFAVDLIAHLLLTLLLTQLIMCGMRESKASAFDGWVEFAVLALFLLDEIPDILLEGVDRGDATELRDIVLQRLQGVHQDIRVISPRTAGEKDCPYLLWDARDVCVGLAPK